MLKKILFTLLFLLTTQVQARDIILAEKAYVDDLATKRVRPAEMAAAITAALTNYATKTYVDAIATNNYSTSEVVVGKWINGKPIYKRTYTHKVNALGIAQTVIDDAGVFDEIIKSEVMYKSVSTWIVNGPLYYASAVLENIGYIMQPYIANNNLIAFSNILIEAYYLGQFYLTYYYTKTTD
jgi:hypothetical protein